MVETISPVVYGTRSRWLGAVALHAVGAAATAAAFGAAVAAAARLLGAPWGRAGLVTVAAAAALYAARDLFGLPIPIPQLRRQVPDWWRTYFGRPLAAVLYGAGLGVGFLTFLGHGTLVVVAVGVAATGRPALGALLMTPFGLARGLAPLVAAGSRDREDGRRLVDRLTSMSGTARSVLNAAASIAVAAAAAAAMWLSSGGWGEAAAAALAVTFAWAALSKVSGWRRWRLALSAHVLPRGIERAASWVVPSVEALVPTLTIAGRGRAAAGLAVVALVAFSAVLLRDAARDGARVPCGCFGRAVVDVRAALARNGALAAAGLIAWIGARPDPPVRMPVGGEVLPAALAAGALAVAAVTLWRTFVWLGRGQA